MAAISLVIQAKPQVWIPVNLHAPIDGTFTKIQIELLVELETRDKVDAIFAKSAKAGKSVDQGIFESTVINWRGIGSDSETELPFNKANVKSVIAQAWLLEPSALAIMQAHRGIVEAEEKN